MSSLHLQDARASISGTFWPAESPGSDRRALVVALHGGGFGAGYFTGVHPLPQAAALAGFDVALLDRPGTSDSHFLTRDGDVLADNAAALDGAVARLWQAHGAGRPGIFLIGHSIGGAIALMLAARPPRWPLVGVSVSGIADRAPPFTPPLPDPVMMPALPPLPRPALAAVMVAPGAAQESVLDALAAASTPAVTEELAAIYALWPSQAERVLAAIGCPVQIVLAEHERLWAIDVSTADRLRRARKDAPTEVILWPGVGHCIDYHAQGPDFHRAVFAFAGTCGDSTKP